MQSKHPVAFWITFSVVAVLFLFSWFLYWEVKRQGLGSLSGIMEKLPVPSDFKGDVTAVGFLADTVMNTDGEERVYLILFQNDLELRPGGGFIGSFGILKVKDGHVTDFAIHDSGIFDGRIPDTVAPPYPMKETLGIPSWKLRDSNWEPDFPTNARKAVEFYELGQGGEEFDGVVGITTSVLSSFLRVTGPVEVPGYPGQYSAENAILDLEYQVEKGYVEQGIDAGERKSVMGILGDRILTKIRELPPQDLFKLFQVLLEDLDQKDIQLSFTDEDLQRQVESAGWAGTFDGGWPDDFVMAVDANLNSWKSDAVMKRSLDYEADLSGEIPRAKVTIRYEHTGKVKDFMTKDYQTFLRLYVPDESWLRSVSGNANEPVFGDFMGKKYFGVLVHVPLGTSKEVSFEYDLPKDLKGKLYDLKIQKQPGVNGMPVTISIVSEEGAKTEKDIVLNRDFVLSRTTE